MTGFGIGSANPAAVVPGLPLGANRWSTGGAWDLISVPGANGDPITANVASQSGSNLLAPASSPLINTTAVGGQRGCYVQDTGVSNTEPRFSCNALASLLPAGQSWGAFWDWRQNKVAQMPMWSGLSTLNTDAMGCLSIGERLAFRYTIGGVTTTVTGSIPLAYDYHRLGCTYDGTNVRLYVDGVLDTTAAVPSLAITLNRFTVFGSVTTVAFEGATGFGRRFFFTPTWVSGPEVATVDAYFVAGDWTLPITNPLVPFYVAAGASIMVGSSDHVTGGGYRYGIVQAIINGRYSWGALGDHPQGVMPLRETPSTSGASAAQIATQVASFVNARTGLVLIDLGNQEINSGFTHGQVEAAIVAALHTARTSYYAVNPNGFMATSTILPYFEAGFNAVTADVNAALPAIWAASDAEFPGSPKLMICQGNVAMGGPSYVQANYDGIGNDHPNNTGYNLLIPAWLAASNASGNSVASVLAALTPT